MAGFVAAKSPEDKTLSAGQTCSKERIMIRASTVGALAIALAMGGWSSQPATPDACKLITLNDANAVVGPPLMLAHTVTDPGFSNCVYHRPGHDLAALATFVEVHYWVMPDVPAAKTKFQSVVHPTPQSFPGQTIAPVPGLADEADIKRTPAAKTCSIEFRRGVAIVTIGTSTVEDSLLKAAAVKAISRL
jgi:hypothetical protein